MSVHKTPDGTYRVKYTKPNGRDGSKNFKRKKDADAFDREQIDRRWGYRSPDAVDLKKRHMSMEDFFQLYLARHTGKAATRHQIEARWCPKKKKPGIQHLQKKWGAWSLDEANQPEMVDEWHAEMRKAGVSAAGQYRAHDLFVALINKAVEWNYLTRSNVQAKQPQYQPKRSDGVWLPATIERLRADLLERTMTPPRGKRGGGVNGMSIEPYRWARHRDATLISVLGYVGPRAGEALAFKWPQLLDGNKIVTALLLVEHRPTHIEDDERGTKTGIGAARTVRIPSWVQHDLRLFWARSGFPRDGYVFPRRRGGEPWTLPGDLSNWNKSVFTPLQERVGVEYRPPKHLRHSCVSTWLRAGMPLDVAARRAGHTIQECERTYRHECEIRDLEDFEPLDINMAVVEARSGFPNLPDFFPVTGTEG